MESNISQLKCVVCDKELTGRKTRFCSSKCKHKDHCKKPFVRKYRNKSKYDLSVKRKIKLISMFESKCHKCGYDKNTAALAFHHSDGSKEFLLTSKNLSSKSWQSILDEASKCVLLCHNCHMEEHYPHLNDFEVREQTAYIKLSSIESDGYCIICKSLLQNNQTKYCSLSCKNKIHNSLYQTSKIQMDRFVNRKIKLIEKCGGKCQSCDYKKNLSALAFHHINPKTKLFTLDASNLANRNFDKCKEEANKCKLVCHNCHCEEHYPYLNKNEN